MAEQGYLILADITGYSTFLNESELEHAQEIITSLIKAVLKPIHPPIILHRVEGDAVFAYTTRNAFMRGQSLLESLENLYFEFALALERNDINSTCTCRACQNMTVLDLKMIVHYGVFGLQDLGGHRELIGKDINLAHRLLKNRIVEATGVGAYLFLTRAAAQAMKLEDFLEILIPHAENYEDLGEVPGFVYNLAPVWKREKERHRRFIAPEEAFVSVTLDLPVPPPVAWDYLNEPSCRAKFRQYDNIPVLGIKQGRLAVGTTYHCAHGNSESPETIIDWKPFEYVTFEGRGSLFDFTAIFQFTYSLAPSPNGTHVDINYAPITVERETALSRIVMPLFRWGFRLVSGKVAERWSNILHEMIEADRSAGRLVLDFEVAST